MNALRSGHRLRHSNQKVIRLLIHWTKRLQEYPSIRTHPQRSIAMILLQYQAGKVVELFIFSTKDVGSFFIRVKGIF